MINEHDYKKSKNEWTPEYKHPTTRLNQWCWEDEIESIDTDSIKKEELLRELTETKRSINFITKYWQEEKKRIKALLINNN
jgi:hypothetical protein